jgi:hypothetical protein
MISPSVLGSLIVEAQVKSIASLLVFTNADEEFFVSDAFRF